MINLFKEMKENHQVEIMQLTEKMQNIEAMNFKFDQKITQLTNQVKQYQDTISEQTNIGKPT